MKPFKLKANTGVSKAKKLKKKLMKEEIVERKTLNITAIETEII